MANEHIGSTFDDFLVEDGILEEVETKAFKRVIAWQFQEEMNAQHLSKVLMAKRMNTSRQALDRLLDPENNSVTLKTMQKAASALGKHLRLELA